MSKNKVYDSLTAIKALEQTDEKLAIKFVSQPNINMRELSAIIEASIMGEFIFKKDGRPLKLSHTVIMAAMSNVIANYTIGRKKDKVLEKC